MFGSRREPETGYRQCREEPWLRENHGGNRAEYTEYEYGHLQYNNNEQFFSRETSTCHSHHYPTAAPPPNPPSPTYYEEHPREYMPQDSHRRFPTENVLSDESCLLRNQQHAANSQPPPPATRWLPQNNAMPDFKARYHEEAVPSVAKEQVEARVLQRPKIKFEILRPKTTTNSSNNINTANTANTATTLQAWDVAAVVQRNAEANCTLYTHRPPRSHPQPPQVPPPVVPPPPAPAPAPAASQTTLLIQHQASTSLPNHSQAAMLAPSVPFESVPSPTPAHTFAPAPAAVPAPTTGSAAASTSAPHRVPPPPPPGHNPSMANAFAGSSKQANTLDVLEDAIARGRSESGSFQKHARTHTPHTQTQTRTFCNVPYRGSICLETLVVLCSPA